MKYIKLFEEFDFTCYKKYKKSDIVWVNGNDDPAEIIEVNYEDRWTQYFCHFFSPKREYWYNERYIIRKLEDWELEALKYNL